jgi:glucose-1-phosphate adenylyltransferase
MTEPTVLGIVLAGGAGTRLAPLTDDRAKPAVPFGGVYRLIDFALSNLANAGIRRMCVLTQYKSHSLDRHITTTWRLTDLLGNYVTPVPAQQRLGPHWYTGSADAIYQSMNLINDDNPDLVVVVGADHVYRMDVRQIIARHLEHDAGVTVAALPVSRQDAKAFGIVGVADDGRTITSFLEKPANPPPLPDSPEESFASMGIYVFSTDVLKDALHRDARDEGSRHDLGGNLIPMLVGDGRALAYDFLTNVVPGSTERDAGYWRDVGTIDAYFDAHMDLRSVAPLFNLYNDKWPILTHMPSLPPAKFVHDTGDRVGRAIDSLVSNGVIVSGGLVRQSVLSPGVRVNSWSRVENSVILDSVQVGRRAVVQNAIIDKNVIIPPGAQVGVDKEHDHARGFVVSPGGITVVGKGQEVPLLWQALPSPARHARPADEGRPPYPRVPAGGLRRRGSTRGVPGPRAGVAR